MMVTLSRTKADPRAAGFPATRGLETEQAGLIPRTDGRLRVGEQRGAGRRSTAHEHGRLSISASGPSPDVSIGRKLRPLLQGQLMPSRRGGEPMSIHQSRKLVDRERKKAHGLRNLGVTMLDTDRIKRAAVAIWMNCLIAAVVGVGAFTTGELLPPGLVPDPTWAQRALTVFAIWVLSFVPGWLYVRFICLRKEALWNEYVLNLYRLGLDKPEYLPPPPAESVYAEIPGAREGGDEHCNIYRQKFNAFYGRKISASLGESGRGYPVVDTLFPLFLCTVTLAVAWTVILWNPIVV